MAAGAQVTALARGLATSLVVPDQVRLLQGDVRVRDEVAAAIEDAEVVFACAGRSGAAASFDDAAADVHTNVIGLLNVLDVLRTRGRKPKVVFPSSRLIYGRPDTLPVSESATPSPQSPYALDKLQCEQYLALYQRHAGIPYAVARISNPFGPAPAPGWIGYNVINAMLQRALRGQTLTVYGDGAQLRDYIFIDDVADGLLALGASEAPSLLVNLASGTGRSLVDAVHAIVGAAGSGQVEHIPWPQRALDVESGDFVADISHMMSLGWTPAVSFEDGLKRSVTALRKS